MFENVQDRGSKKWTSLMLPEHVERIRSLNEELRQDKKPRLDDLELSLISEEIGRAYESKSTIRLAYWRDGYIRLDYGVPTLIDVSLKKVTIADSFGTTQYPFAEIVGVVTIH